MSGIVDQVTKKSSVWKASGIVAGTTLAIWTPTSSARIALTGLHLSSFGNATGTVHIFFSTSLNTTGTKVGVYALGTTGYLNPEFPGLEGGLDVPLNAVSRSSDMNITAIGTEF